MSPLTEVTSEGWFSRIKNAIFGVLIGILLIVGCTVGLFVNEGRAVKTYRSLKEGAGAFVAAKSDTVDPANDGKLIHLSGMATADEILEDKKFNISVAALKLRRTAEMYQWKERTETKSKKKVGGGKTKTTTYHYEKTWSGGVINSSSFKEPEGHQNPTQLPFKGSSWTAKKITIDAYELSAGLKNKISGFKDFSLPDEAKLPSGVEGQKTGNGFYIGANPASAAVGDIKIDFQKIDPHNVSLLSKQAGNSFIAWTSSNGRTIEDLRAGIITGDQMFEKLQSENTMMTWIIRAAGFIFMAIGFMLVFKPLQVMADVLPFMGSIVGAGLFLIAALIAGVISFFTIAIAWVFYRPILGISLLAIAVVLLFLLISKMRKGKEQLA